MNKNKISVSHNGNSKLGKSVSTFSRPVGNTCSNNCIHLDLNCYAERTERIYPNTRKAYLKNLKISNWQKLRVFLLEAKKRGNIVRWHQNGDVMREDSLGRKILDIKYIQDIEKANQSIIDSGIEPPAQLMYTHSIYPRVAKLSKYMELFASIDDTLSYRKAKKCGFKRFAWNVPYRKGVDNKKMWENELGKKIIVCWEQNNLKESCDKCLYCWKKNQKDIGFLQH